MKKLKQAMAGQSSLLVNSKFGASIKVLKKDGHRAQLTFLTAIFKLGVLYFLDVPRISIRGYVHLSVRPLGRPSITLF